MGIPVNKWEDNIKVGLEQISIESVDWLQVVLDREQDAIINPPVPQKLRIL
jgi:hypothetical protein